MIQFSEAGVCFQNPRMPVLLLDNITVNEQPSSLEFKVQKLGNILLVGFGLGFVHVHQSFMMSRLVLSAVSSF